MRKRRRDSALFRKPLFLAGISALLGTVVGCGQSEENRAPDKAAPAPTSASVPNESSDWMRTVKASIAANEYRIGVSGKALAAFNRSQGMQASWQDGALSLLSTTQTKKGALSVRALGFGRGSANQSFGSKNFAAGACRSDGVKDPKGDCLRRIERSAAQAIEYWENRPGGLEQGFVINESPKGNGKIRVDIEFKGGTVALDKEGTVATIKTRADQTFRYSRLVAWDADKKTLPARMRARSGGLALEVDDTGAKYPIVIDPLLTAHTVMSVAWSKETNEATMGTSFDVVVGSAGDVNNDGYDDIFASFAFSTQGALARQGHVFVYHGSASGPTTTAAWTGNGTVAQMHYGRAANRAGDVNGDGFGDFIVGATGYNGGIASEGKIFVYHGSGAGLATTAAFEYESDLSGSAFLGSAVAPAGDVDADGYDDVIVGVRGADVGATNGGRIMLFRGSAAGLSTGVGAFESIDGTSASLQLGFYASGAGDVNGDGNDDVIVSGQGASTTGTAYVFLGDATGIANTAAWSYTGTAGGNLAPVTGAGDLNGDGYADIAVGEWTSSGQVFVFHGSGSGPSVTPSVTILGTATERLGRMVSGAGDVNADGYSDLIVGAPFRSVTASNEEGVAHLFLGGPSGVAASSSSADQTIQGSQVGAHLGGYVAGAGDVNGDGYSDIMIGADNYSSAEANEGLAVLYLGGPESTGVKSTVSWTATGTGAHGTKVSNAGDVNGDGYDDVLVAAPNAFGAGDGNVYVYHGAAGGPSTTAAFSLGASTGAGGFAAAIAGGGDINGDGYSDIVVGAPDAESGMATADEGRIYIYPGSSSGTSSSAFTHEIDVAGARFGASLALADVNADGRTELVVGAPGINSSAGRIYVFIAGSSGLNTTTPQTKDGASAGDLFGTAVAAAGDVNADGYGDVAVGAPGLSSGAGRVYAYLGANTGLSAGAPYTVDGAAGAALGSAVGSAGDVTGDGYADVVGGSPGYDNTEVNEGRVSVFPGGAAAFGTSWHYEPNVAGAAAGTSVAGGDLNGDGYGDVVVGAPGDSSSQGRAYVFLAQAAGAGLGVTPSSSVGGSGGAEAWGTSVATADVNGDAVRDLISGVPSAGTGQTVIYYGNVRGRAFRLRGQNSAQTLNVPRGGVVPSATTSFRVTMNALSARGISKAKLEVERKAVGTAFDGTGTVLTGSFTSTGLTGVELTHEFTGLSMRSAHHFRARLVYDPTEQRINHKTPWKYGGVLGLPAAPAARLDGVSAGVACSLDVECGSGFCVDGVCCNSACGGNVTTDCQACSVAAGASADGTCTTKAMGTSCTDGNACTTGDTCNGVATSCQVGTAVTCTASSSCHDVGVCDPGTGVCSNPLKANGSSCTDGDACTTGETCTAGTCGAPTSTVTCTASDQCHTAGTCNPATGVCSNPLSPVGTACEDGNLCTVNDVCVLGTCTTGGPKVCVALSQCHDAGTCDLGTGLCSNPTKANGTTCSDSNACTSGETCTAGTCGTPSSTVTCTASDQCHDAGVCDTTSGLCSNPAKANGTTCNDSSACTTGETCQAGTCGAPTSTVTCTASDQCHDAGVCNAATGVCSNPEKANGTSCTDGNACTTGDSCQSGTCGGTAVTCTASDQCHDAGTCDTGTGVCSNPVKANGTTCNDGNACTTSDTCQAGACSAGTTVTCTASDQCHTAGTCDPGTGVCSNPAKANGTTCDDSNACTTGDSCQTGTCTPVTTTTCTASDQCHDAGTCDPGTGVCSNPAKANGTTCTDSNACTTGDSCQAGTCTPVTTTTCTASDQCHDVGTCDPGTGTCSNPVKTNGTACADGNACTTGDTCQTGTCTPSGSVTCTASDQCHDAGTCNTATGVCSNPAKTDGTTCTDGNACTTTDTCQTGTCTPGTAITCTASDQCHDAGTCDTSTGVCSNPAKANGTTCADGNACTTGDSCQSGTCTPSGAVTCTASDQCHDAGTCNTATGTCSNPAKADGTTCTDGNACTTTDTCQTGTCTAGTAVTCTASDQCHDVGTCDTTTGVCSNPAKANGTTCTDGNACTTTDTCQTGTCTAGPAVTCTASSQCHDVGVCDTTTGTCSNPVKVNGTSCNDTNACTTGETCQAGSCSPATTVTCAAPDQCHDPGTCNTTTGNCDYPNKPNGTTCTDGNACTTTDSCQAGVCAGSTPVTCAALSQCHTAGTCDATTGVCSNPVKATGTSCDDGSVCTVMDACAANGACIGSARVCNDNNPCTIDSCVVGMGGCVYTPVVGACTPVDAGTDAGDAGTDAGDVAATDGLTTDGGSGTDVPVDTGVKPDTTTPPVDTGVKPDTTTPPVDTGVRPDATIDTSRDTGKDAPVAVGGGGGCDCDVGSRGKGSPLQAALVIGLGAVLFSARRRRRR